MNVLGVGAPAPTSLSSSALHFRLKVTNILPPSPIYYHSRTVGGQKKASVFATSVRKPHTAVPGRESGQRQVGTAPTPFAPARSVTTRTNEGAPGCPCPTTRADLSVSVSFNIASELLDAAKDEQIAPDELISLVLGFAIIFSAVQARLNKTLGDRRKSVIEKARSKARARVSELKEQHGPALGGLFSDGFVHAAEHAAVSELATKRSGLLSRSFIGNHLRKPSR